MKWCLDGKRRVSLFLSSLTKCVERSLLESLSSVPPSFDSSDSFFVPGRCAYSAVLSSLSSLVTDLVAQGLKLQAVFLIVCAIKYYVASHEHWSTQSSEHWVICVIWANFWRQQKPGVLLIRVERHFLNQFRSWYNWILKWWRPCLSSRLGNPFSVGLMSRISLSFEIRIKWTKNITQVTVEMTLTLCLWKSNGLISTDQSHFHINTWAFCGLCPWSKGWSKQLTPTTSPMFF